MTREEAIDVLKHNYPSTCFTDLCEAVEIAIQALSAQPERANGKWINDGDPATWICSNCGYRVEGYNNTKFCPNCGADMRKNDEYI